MKKLIATTILTLAIFSGLTATAEAKNDKTTMIVVTKIAGKTFVSTIMTESRTARFAWCAKQKACAKIGEGLEHEILVKETKLPNGKLMVQWWYINKLDSLKISQIVRKVLVKKFLK